MSEVNRNKETLEIYMAGLVVAKLSVFDILNYSRNEILQISHQKIIKIIKTEQHII